MTEDEKTSQRNEILAVLNPKTEEAPVLPPATPPGLTAEQQVVLADNYVKHILLQPLPRSKLEQEAVRRASVRALRGGQQ